MTNQHDQSEPLFPVIVLRHGDPMPEAPTAYLVGSDGIFVRNTTIAFESVTPASEIPSLQKLEPVAEYLLPPMPPECVAQILLFFRAVWEKSKSEAILLISYHPRRGTFRLDAPPQGVSPMHIHYDMPRIPSEFVLVGSVHSHGSLSAGHSGTDLDDELNFDGIHITFGRMDRHLVEIVATLGVGGERFPQKISRVFGGTRLYDCYLAPTTKVKGSHSRRAVMTYCCKYLPAMSKAKKESRNDMNGFRLAYRGYRIDVPDDVLQEDYTPRPEWFEEVTHEPPRVRKTRTASTSTSRPLYLDPEFDALVQSIRDQKNHSER